MKAYVFPGQGAQFVGMGKDLYDNSPEAKALFEQANEILGFNITDIMFAEPMKSSNKQKSPSLPFFCTPFCWLKPWV